MSVFAECPDCGGHLYLSAGPAAEVYRCRGGHDALAAEDVYLEHDEQPSIKRDETGKWALYIVTDPQA